MIPFRFLIMLSSTADCSHVYPFGRVGLAQGREKFLIPVLLGGNICFFSSFSRLHDVCGFRPLCRRFTTIFIVLIDTLLVSLVTIWRTGDMAFLGLLVSDLALGRQWCGPWLALDGYPGPPDYHRWQLTLRLWVTAIRARGAS
ncbi:hypothetical protein GE09DRAFT_739098 [Coniochaeta sp. 2T2.1]|nr:hypothetical protein GE09DRAFT_739098 [Coniochaeta sp. 2T2.1]